LLGYRTALSWHSSPRVRTLFFQLFPLFLTSPPPGLSLFHPFPVCLTRMRKGGGFFGALPPTRCPSLLLPWQHPPFLSSSWQAHDNLFLDASSGATIPPASWPFLVLAPRFSLLTQVPPLVTDSLRTLLFVADGACLFSSKKSWSRLLLPLGLDRGSPVVLVVMVSFLLF